jgi:hypothetical protein
MNEADEQPTVVMESSLSYFLKDEGGKELASGEAKAQLDEEHLEILPRSGETISMSLRDILAIDAGDYKFHLTLTSKETLTLSNLGYRYEDFLKALSRLRNELILKDMLMHETIKKPGVEADLILFDESGKERYKGTCEARLYETGLVVIPEKAELARIPYSDISGIRDEDWTTTITTEFGEKLVLSKMGRQTDSFKKVLSDSINQLAAKVQTSLKELLPKTDPATIRRVAQFMKEGRAAKRSDIESVSPGLWKDLEKKLALAGMKQEYDFLSSLAQQTKLCIGLKRGLLGDLTGEYLWFLIPIYGTNPKDPGNAIALEAGSEGEGTAGGDEATEGAEATRGEEATQEGEGVKEEGAPEEAEAGGTGGRATYFFRIVSRQDYPNFKKIEDLHRATDDFISKANRALVAINFRREPIYLPDERLEEPRYQKYLFSIEKLPALQMLRSHFIGRVIHSSPDQWKNDVMGLLKFNVSTRNDSARWSKAKEV